MPRRVQSGGEFEEQFREIIDTALDKTIYAEVTTHATPDTEFSIEHGMGVIPTGYIPIKQDKAASIYDGTTANTTSLLYLRCNVASVAARILIF